jgi:hypothetical protein
LWRVRKSSILTWQFDRQSRFSARLNADTEKCWNFFCPIQTAAGSALFREPFEMPRKDMIDSETNGLDFYSVVMAFAGVP